jgi:hypothetical protein
VRRPQPVGHHGEQPVAYGRACGCVLDASDQAFQQDDEFRGADIGAYRASLLGVAQQDIEGCVQVLLERARDRDGVGQVALGGGFGGERLTGSPRSG